MFLQSTEIAAIPYTVRYLHVGTIHRTAEDPQEEPSEWLRLARTWYKRAVEAPKSTVDQQGRLSRGLLASTALALIEREGPRALSMRRVARELGVGAMSLYTYFPSRQALVTEVAHQLFHEVDTSPTPGERWDDTIRRVVTSYRDVALRHPNVYLLVSGEDSALFDHAERVLALHRAQGMPVSLISRVWMFLDAFLDGFLRAEIRSLGQGEKQDPTSGAMAAIMNSHTTQSFLEGLEIMISGVAQFAPKDAEWRSPKRPQSAE